LRDKNAEFNAAGVCESIASALDGDKGINTAIHDLITEYVAALAEIWLQHGIKPARAAHPSNPNYRGKFHRFADLVLTSAVEPWSRRHDGDNQELLATLREADSYRVSALRLRPAMSSSATTWLFFCVGYTQTLTARESDPYLLQESPGLGMT